MSVPHLNELQDTYGDKGLTIIGVTDEGESDTVKWVAAKKAKYAYAYDKGGKLKRFFGVSGIPHAVLVDATGTVVWDGHPASLDAQTIEKALGGALPKPLWEWPKPASAVKAALIKRDYKVALDAAAKLSEADQGPALIAAIQNVVKGRVEGMSSAYAQGNFLTAETEAKALQKQLAGLPELERATQMLADLAANKDAPEVIKAQRQIAKLRDSAPTKSKELDAAIEDLQKIVKALPGTYAATEATTLSGQFRKQKTAKK